MRFQASFIHLITKKLCTYSSRKVLLISATPLNNQPRELLNLFALFQETRNSTLGVSDLVAYFNEKQRDYDVVRREGVPAAEALIQMKRIYKDIREKILQDVVIRRTRSDLLEHDEYKKDLDAQGIRFPVIQKPRILQYYLDTDLDALYEDYHHCLNRRTALHNSSVFKLPCWGKSQPF